ncbi:DUF6463 family protein [Nocardia heshunensis]
MIKWSGWLITLCGAGHTIGALLQTAPHYAGNWFSGKLWHNTDPLAMTHPTAAFWYTAYSFGPPLLAIGLLVLWLDRRGITPPPFLAWGIAGWTVITAILSGPSPLPLLLIAALLLLIAARRTAQAQPKSLSDA